MLQKQFKNYNFTGLDYNYINDTIFTEIPVGLLQYYKATYIITVALTLGISIVFMKEFIRISTKLD